MLNDAMMSEVQVSAISDVWCCNVLDVLVLVLQQLAQLSPEGLSRIPSAALFIEFYIFSFNLQLEAKLSLLL